MRCWHGAALGAVLLGLCAGAAAAQHAVQHTVLDRVAAAVDGAESSHGQDLAMWRLDPFGPQGPMQVTAAAATDVGGGDRFDEAENRAIGRAYLRQLYQRYKNWPDAIAAYNWGIGKLNAWLGAGRPADKLGKGVAAYTDRVLRDSGLCAGRQPPVPGRLDQPRFAARSRHRALDKAGAPDEALGLTCGGFAAAASAAGGRARWQNDNRLLVGLVPEGLFRQLDAAIQQTALDMQRVEQRFPVLADSGIGGIGARSTRSQPSRGRLRLTR
jgi:hypothetical protein